MASDAIETAQENVREGAETAVSDTRETAKQAGSQARSTLREQADQRSSQAGERVKSFAGDFHSTAEELRKQGKDQPANMIEQVADRAEGIGDYLERSDGEKLLNDVERFGRERPWAIAAAGFAIGLTASRLLKASSADRYDRSSGQRNAIASQSTGPPTTGDGFSDQPVPDPVTPERVMAGNGAPPMGV